ncbi:hypothetical protein BD413DRAFT_533551 [Trametes elegans]|nr:hypothetical protein BD413DRAFT_533551 [Trametes elegans]
MIRCARIISSYYYLVSLPLDCPPLPIIHVHELSPLPPRSPPVYYYPSPAVPQPTLVPGTSPHTYTHSSCHHHIRAPHGLPSRPMRPPPLLATYDSLILTYRHTYVYAIRPCPAPCMHARPLPTRTVTVCRQIRPPARITSISQRRTFMHLPSYIHI